MIPALPHRDVITLTGVRARGHHGVLADEKRDGQDFLVDTRLHLDTAWAARDDALARTVNYAEVAEAIAEVVGGPPLDLIETLTERLAQRILSDQVLVRTVEVTVHKPSAPIPVPFTDVAVSITREAAPRDAVVALGSNLGDRAAHLQRALEALAADPLSQLRWASPVVETDPVGPPAADGTAQQDYLNAIIGLSTVRGPYELLDLAHAIEQEAGRERTVRWGARTLDVDVLTWGTLRQDDPALTLPHPRAHERSFVLVPWQAADPDAFLPGHGPILDLPAAANAAGVRPGPRVPGFGAPA